MKKQTQNKEEAILRALNKNQKVTVGSHRQIVIHQGRLTLSFNMGRGRAFVHLCEDSIEKAVIHEQG